ncbi:MAG: glycyl-radical enzyme activating protein [Solobacterium sp.]|jgi:pyruvate formate lyase activating enzyme|nr:glycyl-radical enzyme activating protein [Solobacterium sp.]MCH4222229.1 glycyl-radical enzyme activating protein [Solobacterium sp.]MCH4265749.1 glycyl-radical enzyme activating protein [Solobacterium sp.]
MTEVFNIERFATHDGPGIRTTVFFKGCGMHCPWCANPESWGTRPILLHEASRCTGCGRCKEACAQNAITIDEQWHLNFDQCTLCRKCEHVCLNDAISFAGTSMSTSEILKEVLKDRDYYDNSGGGLTVSGGDPFLQNDSLVDLLKQAKRAGLTTAVETAGYYPLAYLKNAMPWIDLYLFDQKHSDAAKLKEVTGAEMDTVDTNLKYLASMCPEKVIIRIPVIPGFNQDPEVIHAIYRKVSALGFKRADLLPYHTLAKAKWMRMCKAYPYGYDVPLKEEDLQQLQQDGIAYDLSVNIGG